MEQRRNGVVAVTGVGSMPGEDPAEATRIVAGELDVPHVVELPARGPGADMIGRALGLLVAATGEFGGETTPSGWRVAGGRSGGQPGRQMRRAASWLAEDTDRLEEALAGFTGTLKLQVAGPWTLAGCAESVRGTRLLADSGACADLAAALGEAVAGHVADVARRVPGATVVLQVDEPMLPMVAAGALRTPSGRGAVRTPGAPELVAGLAIVTDAVRALGAVPAVHCCAREVPFDLLARAGFAVASVDVHAMGRRADDSLRQWWDSGRSLVLGVAPALDPARLAPEDLAREVSGLWSRIGFGVATVGQRTWLSPSCGLAGASSGWALQVGGTMRRAAALLDSAD